MNFWEQPKEKRAELREAFNTLRLTLPVVEHRIANLKNQLEWEEAEKAGIEKKLKKLLADYPDIDRIPT